MLLEKVECLIEKVSSELSVQVPDFFNNISVKEYINLLSDYPDLASYSFASLDTVKFCQQINESYGISALESFHKLVLLSLIKKNIAKLPSLDLPEKVISNYYSNFSMIVNHIQDDSYCGCYLFENDKFKKDLAVCSLRLIPVGARKIHLSKLPRRFLISNGFFQFILGLYVVLFKLKGIGPLYEMHVDSGDPELISEFTEQGWKKTCQIMAEMLKKNKNVKGVFGGSWLYDPELEKVSPHLAFCRKVAVENGALTFKLGQNESAINNATKTSKTRRKLWRQGRYQPTNYQLIWPRAEIIKFSEK